MSIGRQVGEDAERKYRVRDPVAQDGRRKGRDRHRIDAGQGGVADSRHLHVDVQGDKCTRRHVAQEEPRDSTPARSKSITRASVASG